MQVKSGKRLVWTGVFVLLVYGALGGRLYHLHITMGEQYAQMAYGQRALALPVGNRRGLIFDRNGTPLTDPHEGWGVAVFPPLVHDPTGTAKALSTVLNRSEAELIALLQPRSKGPFWLQSDVRVGLVNQVQNLGLPGIVSGPVAARYGPESLARHLIGYVNETGGQLGLERAFDRELSGTMVPSLVAYLDGKGRTLGGAPARPVIPTTGKEPYNLHTTLDVRVQRAVEQVLDQHRHPDGGPMRGAAVVMDPRTGEVLAIASRPQFDYAHLGDLLGRPEGSGTYLLNRAINDYPPGSVFKVVIAAAALESGVVSLDDTFVCTGHYDVGGHSFKDAGAAHGTITFREAIAKSCNVVFLKVGYERLGIPGMKAAATRFGFGQTTGAAGQEEHPGMLPQGLEDGAIQLAFGQGKLEVTPLQVARAFSAVANGGTLPAVKLVTAVKSAEGEVMERLPVNDARRIMTEQTAAHLREALVGVTDPEGGGTGKAAWVPQVGAAGKTGSAEGQDANGQPTTHAWFAGFLPAAQPRYVVAVVVESGGGGGATAAPIFREIGTAIVQRVGSQTFR